MRDELKGLGYDAEIMQFNKAKKVDDNTIVIYPEVIEGNPLNAPHVIRWILAEVGINVNNNIINSWGKNDLVYYFNCENKFYNSIFRPPFSSIIPEF